MVDATEVPDGLDKAGIEAMTVLSGEWRICDDFACARCGHPAFFNPYTNLIWGCKLCGFTTYSVGIYFREVARAA